MSMSSATASATTDYNSFMELSSWEIEFSWTSTHRDSCCCGRRRLSGYDWIRLRTQVRGKAGVGFVGGPNFHEGFMF